MTQVEQAMAIIVITIGVAVAMVILAAGAWVVLSLVVKMRQLTRELR